MYSLVDTNGLLPQTIKGYLTCLASILSHTGKAVVPEKTYEHHPPQISNDQSLKLMWNSKLDNIRNPNIAIFLLTFATTHFLSPIPDDRALAVDALLQPWKRRSMYMFSLF